VTLAEPPAPADQPVNFREPPVTEVVLAMQFERAAIDLEVLADFATRVKADFPQRDQRPPLPPMAEDFSKAVAEPEFSLELASRFEMPRTWFSSADGTRILQLQEDRLVFNWQRAHPNDADYPRYLKLREAFRERLAQLLESIEAAGGDVPGTNFCEVTYVNQMELGEDDPVGASTLADILAPLDNPEYAFLPFPEDQRYGARFLIPEDGESRGRLYVNAAPAARPDGTSMYVMNLTSRLKPRDSSPGSAWDALDLGRNWIVQGFVDLTTKKMHERWGYKEGVDG